MPSDPTTYLVAGLVLLVVLYLCFHEARAQVMQKRLLETGDLARATVVSARQTGSWVANNPVLAMTLRVSEDGHPDRELQAEKVVPVMASGLFMPGAVIRLRIDPTDPNNFVFDEPWASK
ncbi:hypothetical protein F0U60_27050 [Archangium minus]|uniref:Uncharacterized protein n=1 Tax=Archangium minus TaxID=83450 RepID=A0ABY9WW55_9BACT|nr:hypothetical protein F0U60_27050 [Archangium minus]